VLQKEKQLREEAEGSVLIGFEAVLNEKGKTRRAAPKKGRCRVFCYWEKTVFSAYRTKSVGKNRCSR
jgi:hypothetical protein